MTVFSPLSIVYFTLKQEGMCVKIHGKFNINQVVENFLLDFRM